MYNPLQKMISYLISRADNDTRKHDKSWVSFIERIYTGGDERILGALCSHSVLSKIYGECDGGARN